MRATKLFIVESPGKIKTLRKILGAGWMIEASVGHTTELAYDGPKRLGFELRAAVDGKAAGVVTRYVPRGDRGREVLKKLKRAAAEAELVVLATDPDREGEAIAWHLVEQLRIKRYERVVYTQITEAAVRKALAQPSSLNVALIDAQRARQCLDKLVGFEVSPLLWASTGGKSAGRVQSATLHLICERERERLAFKPEDYWVLKSRYGEGFEAVYEPPGSRAAAAEPVAGSATGPEHGADALERNRVRTQEEADRIASIARSNPHVVESREQKSEPKPPPQPLITSSLQQAAGAKFKFSPKQTMQVAQQLYEGVEGKGLITYMRTDAVTLSPEFVAEARDWLRAHAPDCLPEKAPVYRAKAEAQAAHEAIRPTSAGLTPEQARAMLSPDQLKLYTLIWERAIASQCKPAMLSKTKISIRAAETLWVARGTVVVEEGYLRFWKNLDGETELPALAGGRALAFQDVDTRKHATKPPPRYSEPRLVQLMERKGIGRPSTYASTISTLKEREYVRLESLLLVPTPLGLATDEALTRALPDLVDAKFTADMEAALDRIAEGKQSWEAYLLEWNSGYLEPALVTARERLAGIARVPGGGAPAGTTGAVRASTGREPPDRADKLDKALAKARQNDAQPKCPRGHGDLVLRLSKKEKFYWKCLFPECATVAWYQEFSSQKCPACGAKLEKIPSKKVTGGYFLKCARRQSHPDEVLFFKNRKTKEWEQAKSRFEKPIRIEAERTAAERGCTNECD